MTLQEAASLRIVEGVSHGTRALLDDTSSDGVPLSVVAGAAIIVLMSSRPANSRGRPADAPDGLSLRPKVASAPAADRSLSETEQPPARPGGRRWDRWASLAALVLVSIGFGAISPALAGLLGEFGGGAALGAVLVASLGAGRLVGGFPAGMVVERIGTGRVILAGTVTFLVGSLVAAAAPEFPFLALGRFVQGIGLGIVPAGVLAVMMAGEKAEKAGGAMALYQFGLTAGGALGPAIGGPAAAVGGWRMSLLACAVAGVIAIALAVPLARRSIERAPARKAVRGRLGWMGAGLVFLALVPHLVTFLYRMSYSQLALPLYASGPAGFDPAVLGLLLGSQAIVAALMLGPAGWMTNRFGVRPVLAGSLVLAATGVALTPILPAPLGLWIAVSLFGAGLAVMGVASGLFIFTLGGYSTGMLVSIYRLSGDVMQVLGPMVVGPVLEAVGFEWAFFGMAGCGVLALLSLGIRGETHRDDASRGVEP